MSQAGKTKGLSLTEAGLRRNVCRSHRDGRLFAIPLYAGADYPAKPFHHLAGLLLGGHVGALSQATYILVGLAGLPVFAGGKAGLRRVARTYGGLLIGFVPGLSPSESRGDKEESRAGGPCCRPWWATLSYTAAESRGFPRCAHLLQEGAHSRTSAIFAGRFPEMLVAAMVARKIKRSAAVVGEIGMNTDTSLL